MRLNSHTVAMAHPDVANDGVTARVTKHKYKNA